MRRLVGSQAEMAKELGLNLRTLRAYVLRGCPCAGADKADGRYSVAAVRQWLDEHALGRHSRGELPAGAARTAPGSSRKPTDLAALQQRKYEADLRAREEGAQLSSLKRRKLEGTLVSRDLVRECLSELAAMLRRGGETLQRQFGPEAQEILDETLEAWERRLNDYFPETDDHDPRPTEA